MSNGEDDFVDLVDGEQAKPHSMPPSDGLDRTPESVEHMLEAGQSPLGEPDRTVEQEKKLKQEVMSDQERRRTMEKIERDMRLEEIKNDPKLQRQVGAFLRDMAGAERMSIVYRPVPWIALELQVMTGSDLEEVTKQNLRDLFMNRTRFVNEANNHHMYRLAMSLKSYTFSDPQSKACLAAYGPDVCATELANYSDDTLDIADFTPRRRARFLLSKYLVSESTYRIVLAAFGEFETLLSNLSFLAAEDPDFFQRCLVEEPSRG